ncbi:MAG: hypothetical protein EXS36_01510 [Pedosphaera sp.]|nr:hypothetical protein [Pedosphaera sp.]
MFKITSAPPAVLEVQEGSELKLEVAVEGTGSFTFQWKKGGANIPDATAALYKKTPGVSSCPAMRVPVTLIPMSSQNQV